MRERPILLNGPMVNAALDGSKTQTRRLVKGFALELLQPGNFTPEYVALPENGLSPFGFAGDRLWVRETWQHSNHPLGPYDDDCLVFYRADYLDDPLGPDLERSPDGIRRQWRPSIHMPRAAARTLLDVTSVRIERLNSISDEDCIAEGIGLNGSAAGVMFSARDDDTLPRAMYRDLWESIYGIGSWSENPWVWVGGFERVDGAEGA
ncbi:hypothetical protein DA70_09785 [Pandoraea pnomenusa]|uniref:hypothetical protein n=1 Tax=Pandoraea pnomenusa TaxID=93220 RepID=UPI00043761C9|nr:hypothetical protein [Pandoraea pnomenusa]AHN74713.3 hypothetical protein DA70_09785 [Pandoraea pnomenusa]